MRPFHMILLALLIAGILAWMGMRTLMLAIVVPDFVIGGISLYKQQMRVGTPQSLKEAEETLKVALKNTDLELDPKRPLKQRVLKEYVDYLQSQHRAAEAQAMSAQLAQLQGH